MSAKQVRGCSWNPEVTRRIIHGASGSGLWAWDVAIRPSGEQIAQCPNSKRVTHNNGVSYSYTFIYTYIQ